MSDRNSHPIRKAVTAVVILAAIGLVVWLSIKAIKALWKSLSSHPTVYLILFGFVAVAITSVSLYGLRTVSVNQPENAIVLGKTEVTLFHGIFGDSSHVNFYVSPSGNVLPDMVYRVTLTNGLADWSRNVQWSRLQLDIKKQMYVSIGISSDEYQALKQMPRLTLLTEKIYREHNVLYLFFIPMYFGLIVFCRRMRRHIPEPVTTVYGEVVS